MLRKGDICIVNNRAARSLSGIYRSLIGKRVVIISEDTVFDKYPIRVISPEADKPWERSPNLRMRVDLLTKEDVHVSDC